MQGQWQGLFGLGLVKTARDMALLHVSLSRARADFCFFVFLPVQFWTWRQCYSNVSSQDLTRHVLWLPYKVLDVFLQSVFVLKGCGVKQLRHIAVQCLDVNFDLII